MKLLNLLPIFLVASLSLGKNNINYLRNREEQFLNYLDKYQKP